MSECYICGNKAEIYGQDLGRRKIVRCPKCRYYEITKTAVAKFLAGEVSDDQKRVLAKRIEDIYVDGGEALVSWENNSEQVVDKRTIQD